jgi:hypothetical protein
MTLLLCSSLFFQILYALIILLNACVFPNKHRNGANFKAGTFIFAVRQIPGLLLFNRECGIFFQRV